MIAWFGEYSKKILTVKRLKISIKLLGSHIDFKLAKEGGGDGTNDRLSKI